MYIPFILSLFNYKQIMMNFDALNWFDSIIEKLKKVLDCIIPVIYTCDPCPTLLSQYRYDLFVANTLRWQHSSLISDDMISIVMFTNVVILI